MASDVKHTNAVKLMLTDGELLDLSRLAMANERTVAEMVRFVLRRHMYGACNSARPAGNSNHGAHEAPRGTDWPDTEGQA
ncbi:MAG: hypothetical protein RLY71_2309 [Pseudomonadota bacterium]|jgi:hypothetical protein